jgi:hypothetical protein
MLEPKSPRKTNIIKSLTGHHKVLKGPRVGTYEKGQKEEGKVWGAGRAEFYATDISMSALGSYIGPFVIIELRSPTS